jgi:hypothetical protein
MRISFLIRKNEYRTIRRQGFRWWREEQTSQPDGFDPLPIEAATPL